MSDVKNEDLLTKILRILENLEMDIRDIKDYVEDIENDVRDIKNKIEDI